MGAASAALAARAGVPLRSVRSVVAGLPLHHLEAGAGPPLVLLHGAEGGALNWFRLFHPLSEHHRVLAVDLPGFGSSPPREARAPLGSAAAEVVSAWMEQQALDRPVVIGTSFGGLVALRVAQRPSQVRALVLIDSAGLGRRVSWLVRAAAVLRWRGQGPAGRQFVFRHLLTAGPLRLPDEDRHALLAYLEGAPAVPPELLSLFAAFGGQREHLSEAELRRLAVPTLLLWGERDRFFPVAHSRRAARSMPNVELRVLPEVGHSPNWEAPDAVVAALLPFLRRVG